MTKEIKKLKKYQQPLGTYFLSPKRILFFLIALFIFTIFAFETIDTKVFAATGINRTINFQGKVVNKDGTNVADGQYTFVFKLYDAASGGANPWTETQNNVQVTAGIFRVSLGSTTSFASAGVDFNTDNLYLAINFNSDGEMTPRVRFAAVPYAINAEKVAGLTVTDTTGTLTIPNSKTVQFGGAFTTSAQDLTLTLGGATNVTLPTTGTLATLAGTENLSNKSFTSTLTFSGVTTDITTGTNESLTISPNGVGNVLFQSQSGGQSALIIDKTGLGDIFAASASGVSRFVIKTDGTASSSAGFTVDGVGSVQSTRNQTLTLGGGSTGNLVIGRSGQVVTLGGFDCSGSGNGGKLTTTSGGVLTCAADGGGTSSYSPFQESTIFGINYQVNTKEDFLIGGVATASAKFAILGVAGDRGTQTASISGNITLDASGVIQTTNKQFLTLGGDTTGDIYLRPGNSTGLVRLIHGNSGGGGLILGDSETDGLNKTARIKSYAFSNGTSLPVTMMVANNQSGYNGLNIGGGSGSEYAVTEIHLKTGATAATTVGTTRLFVSSGGLIGIGNDNTAPQGTLDVRSALGTTPTATVSGRTSAAALTIDNTLGDLLTASSSGLKRFTIQNDGNILIGTSSAATEKLTLNGGSIQVKANGDPTVKGAVGTAASAVGIDLSGQYAYVAVTTSGLQIFNINNPTVPTLVSTIDTPGVAQSVDVNGQYAYVADDSSGLEIIDISVPTAPRIVGNIDTFLATDVFVSGRYAYVTDYTAGLLIIDISNPNSPVLVGSYDTPDFAQGIYVVGKFAYVADYGSGLMIFDVSNPSKPSWVGTYNSSGGAFDVSVNGKFAYVADDASGLQIVDISNPAAPTLVGNYNTTGSATDLYVNGKYVYVVDDSKGIVIVDVTVPGSPVVIGNYSTTSTSRGAKVLGKYLYAAEDSAGLKVLDINGLDVPVVYAGNIGTNVLTVNDSAEITNSLAIGNSLSIGGGGLFSSGSFSFLTASGSGNLIQGAPTGQALLALNQTGNQDIFTASASGTSRFSITNSGGIKLGASEGSLGQCLMSNGAGSGATWGGCAAGGNGWWNLISTQGTLVPVNTTLDMLWGGISTSSATFHLFGSINSGTTPVASISANSSFAGLVIDQKGTGDFLTASASGVTKFTITKSGGIYASDGLTINKTGSNDIVKTTSGNNTTDTDFQRTANATSATITNLDNTGGELSLSKGTVSSDGIITTSSQPVTPGALGAGASSITNSTGRYMVIRGGGTTTLYLYNSLSNSFQTATSVTSANVGAGSVTIPRPDGKYLVVHGGGVATTSVIDPNDNVPGVAGPTATGNNGAGTNIYRRQNGQYLLLHGAAAGTTRVYNPVANTFAAGPTAGGTTWGAGSLVLPRQNGTALIVAGGASANTQLYNLDGAAGIGSFTAGPVLPTNCEINNAGSVALQLANGRYIILSKAGVSVEYDPVTNTMGTCQNVGPAGALADGAHAIRLQDRRFLIYRGSGTTDAYIYNPATNTYSTHATATSTQGAGLHSLQKHDGTWMTFVGGSTTTNKYDSQLVMSGSYVSEDINTNSLNPSSSLWFTAGAEALFVGTSSATATTDLPQSGLEISVQTASTQGGLSSATERRIYRNGDPIRAEANDKWIRITANFTRPIPQQIYDERRTWVGNGMTNIIRDYQDPTLYDYMIDNSTVFFRNNFDFVDSQGIQDPTEASSSAFTRVQPMADRITLPWGKVPGPTQISTNGGMYLGSIGVHPPLLAPTADGTLVIQRPGGLISIIASGSANMNLYDPASSQFTAQSGAGNIPTASTGRGAFALKLPNGKFFIVLGNGTSTTNIYDPNAASGSQFVAGPTLSGVAGFGAQPILNKDGTYTILHGGGLTTSTLFNPYTDPIKPSTVTLPVGPVTTIAINCGSWAIPLSGQLQDTYRVAPGVAPFVAGLTTSMTYDSVAKVFTAGPTQTGAHGCGSYAFQRQDGYWVSVAAAGGTTGAQSTATQIINPWSNTNGAGATLTAAVGRGSVVIPRADGTFLITRGQAQTGNGNGSNIYIPWGGTFIVGGPTGTSVAGPNLIDYAATPGTAVQGTGSVTFQRPDGKWVIIAGGQVTGSAIVNLYDAGWYPDGQYQSGQIYAPTLTTSSTMSWKKSSDDFVSFEVRTSPTREAMLTASYDSVSRSGDTIAADSGDKWAQIQINFSRRFLGYDGIYKDSWPSTGAYPALVVSQPTIFEYRINNAYDFLTLKNDGLNVFRVNKYGAVYSGIQGGFYTGGADLAENYSSKEALAKGEVVSIDGVSGDHNIKKSSGQYQSDMLGVVSTNPGFVAGDGTEDAYPVALVGRVPVKVSTENGPIREGDALTSASIPGYAMKATVGGRVLGRALHSFDESTAESCPALGMGNFESTKCGTLMLFVNLVDFNGESVNVAMSNAGFTLNESELPAVAGIDFSEGTDARKQQEILGFLKTQKDNGQGIYTDRVSATQEIISPQIVTDLLIAKKIKAESIEGLEIITNSIETLSNRISTGSAVTNFSDRITLLAHNQDQFQEQMASIAARLEKMDNLNLLTMTNISSGEGQLTTVANLAVFNTATFAQASVLDNLQVGNNMTLSMNAINTVGADLEIQSLRQGAVSFLGGLIRFDTDGKVAFAEDVSFQKNVAVTGVLSAHTVATTDLQLAQGTTTVLTDTEVDSTAAAGLVTLKRGTDHMKINNPLVKENSFIFITPKTKTNQNLFLLDQKEAKDEEEGSFTVGVDAKATDDIKFNYLIVN